MTKKNLYLLLLSCLFLWPSFSAAQSQQYAPPAAGLDISQLPLNEFTFVDAVSDVARQPDSSLIYRIYSTPRITYTDENGIVQKRPDGWNLFLFR